MKKNVYIGKDSIKGKGIAICKVIDTDIATGEATVFNRETMQIEKVTFAEKRTLSKNMKRLAEDTEKEYNENMTY